MKSLGPHGITCNAVLPGTIETDIIAYLAGEARDRLVLLDDEAPNFLPGIGAFYVGGHTMCCATRTALDEAQARSNLTSFDTVDELFEDLGIG